MRDIPLFVTDNGAGSLILSQIPYTKQAYIRIHSAQRGREFLAECIDMCVMAGAGGCYATGDACCLDYPEYTAVVQMQAQTDKIANPQVSLRSVREQTLEQWRQIYNQKAGMIPGAAWMSLQRAQQLLSDGNGYFVYSGETLLGTGMVSGNCISWIASVSPGAGELVMGALCQMISDATVTLEVASQNQKAVALYKKMGFVQTQLLTVWHTVK